MNPGDLTLKVTAVAPTPTTEVADIGRINAQWNGGGRIREASEGSDAERTLFRAQVKLCDGTKAGRIPTIPGAGASRPDRLRILPADSPAQYLAGWPSGCLAGCRAAQPLLYSISHRSPI